MKLVSVIVPIYKVEKYLVHCLESIVHQTYRDLEIILVDDGSPDNCPQICDDYKKKDNRIKVVHKENAGLGFARNSGLKIATGEYVLFVDSDDWLSIDTISALMDYVQTYNPDMIIFGYYNVAPGKIPVCQKAINELYVCNEEVIDRVLLPIIGADSKKKVDFELHISVWNKLYKRSIIEQYNIEFVSEREYLSEDYFFNFDYILNSRKVVFITECYYYYRMNPVSLSNFYKPERFDNSVRLINELQQRIENAGLTKRIEYRLDRLFLMKTRKNIQLIANCSLKLGDKRKETSKILNNKMLVKTLSRYPIQHYAIHHKVPFIFMKYKLTMSVIMLYWLQARIKKFVN
jgi:glycosyltransferase involved in cell wall biosynthesis